MNFPRAFHRAIWLTVTLAFCAKADTFTLKDGTKLEARILREDATTYVLEVQVTKSIKDERVVAKDDVAKIEREKKDLVAFEAIAKQVPTPDFLSADEYAARIREVEKFIKEHRSSSKTKQARAILDALKGEANEILAGGIKINGKLLSAGEYRANALDIDAGVQEAKIRNLLKSGNYLGGLRAFYQFDGRFRNTRSHAALSPLIIQTINSYLAQTAQSLATYDARAKEREAGLQRMQLDDRRNTQAALAEEAASFEARFKAEKEAKIGWVSTDPFFKPALEETMTFGKQELNRLTAATAPASVDAGAAFRDALSKIQNSADPAAASTAVAEARNAMVSEKYLAILEAAAAAPR